MQEEPLHHPTPPTGVPEPLLPPKRKETGSTGRARKRVSRWDPEVTEGDVAPNSGQSEPLVPRFQLFFLPPVGLPKEQVPAVTKLVSQLQALLRRDPPQAVTIVVSRSQCDPMSFSNVSDFGAFLQAFALRSKLSLLSFGKAWSLRYQDKDKAQETTTLFLEVCQASSSSEHFTTRPKTQPGPKHYDRSRSPPMGKPPGPATGSTGPKSSGSGKRPVFQSHGKQRCSGDATGIEQLQATGCEKSKDIKHPLFDGDVSDGSTPLEATGFGEAAHRTTQLGRAMTLPGPGRDHQAQESRTEPLKGEGGVSPTIPFTIEDSTSSEEITFEHMPDIQPGIELHFAVHSDLMLFDKDGRQFATENWVKLQHQGVQAVLRGDRVSALLQSIRDCHLMPIGGFHGCTVIGPSCRFQVAKEQIQQLAVDARAYKARPMCPSCFADTPTQEPIFECPSCQGNLRSFRLPLPLTPQGSQVEKIFHQFQSTQEIGTHSGWCNLAFEIIEIYSGFWFVKGPTQNFWVLFPPCMDVWIRPAVGQNYFLYQAPCVGFVQGCHVLLVPNPNGQGALVRQHGPQDSPRALELFAGIGGWHQARKALGGSEVDILSLEIEPNTAQSLALSTGRPCYDLEQWLGEPLLTDAVLVADIRDHAWWITTLIHPFSELMFSAPCTPWSIAGKQRGLFDHDGLLLLWAAAYAVLFQVRWAAGENVPGLLQHPHWEQVLGIFQSTGLHVQVSTHDLAEFGVMHRKRSFVTLTSDTPRQWPQAPCCSTVQDAGILMPRCQVERTRVPPEAMVLLTQRRLLPANLLSKAYEQGLEDGAGILKLRVHHSGPLPTLVASYRQQTRLDLRHLEERGIFTWLIDDAQPRYLDAFEGARALGFLPTLHLPVSLDQAMRAVGNALSPLQALLVLMTIPETYLDRETHALHNVMRIWLSGCIPLAKCKTLEIGHFCKLVMASLPRSIDFRRLSCVAATCDGVIFPISWCSTSSNQDPTNVQALPLGPPWTVLEVGRSFTEDALLLVFRVHPLRLSFAHGGETKKCLLSPFTHWRSLQLLKTF